MRPASVRTVTGQSAVLGDPAEADAQNGGDPHHADCRRFHERGHRHCLGSHLFVRMSPLPRADNEFVGLSADARAREDLP